MYLLLAWPLHVWGILTYNNSCPLKSKLKTHKATWIKDRYPLLQQRQQLFPIALEAPTYADQGVGCTSYYKDRYPLSKKFSIPSLKVEPTYPSNHPPITPLTLPEPHPNGRWGITPWIPVCSKKKGSCFSVLQKQGSCFKIWSNQLCHLLISFMKLFPSWGSRILLPELCPWVCTIHIKRATTDHIGQTELLLMTENASRGMQLVEGWLEGPKWSS